MNQTPLFDDLVIKPRTVEELYKEVCDLMESRKTQIKPSDEKNDSDMGIFAYILFREI